MKTEYYVHPNGNTIIKIDQLSIIERLDVDGDSFISFFHAGDSITPINVVYEDDAERDIEFVRLANLVFENWYLHPDGSTLVKFNSAEINIKPCMWMVQKSGGGVGITINGLSIIYADSTQRDAQFDLIRDTLLYTY